MSGSGSRIAPCLLESVIRDVTRFTKKAHRLSTLHMVQRLLKESRRGVAINPTVVVVALKELAVELRKAEKCKGIIIIADELGNSLSLPHIVRKKTISSCCSYWPRRPSAMANLISSSLLSYTKHSTSTRPDCGQY